jgi:hypothetical protein
MRALYHWWLRLRLRDLQAQRNLICRLATGQPYDKAPESDGHTATGGRERGGVREGVDGTGKIRLAIWASIPWMDATSKPL